MLVSSLSVLIPATYVLAFDVCKVYVLTKIPRGNKNTN